MTEYKEFSSTVYSNHPLGSGVDGNNVRHDFGNLISVKVPPLSWSEKAQRKSEWISISSEEFNKFFISPEYKERFIFEIETDILRNTNKKEQVWHFVWRNLKFHFDNSPRCFGFPEDFNYNPDKSERSRILDSSSFGTCMCALLDEWSDWYLHSGCYPQWINYLYVSEEKIFFLVKMNQKDQWINSITLKSLDANLYFSVLQEMFERKKEKSKYMRTIFFKSFLSHYGFTKTIENEIVSPCNDVFGCYDLQRYTESFL
jgi:hypothetical protein